MGRVRYHFHGLCLAAVWREAWQKLFPGAQLRSQLAAVETNWKPTFKGNINATKFEQGLG